MKTIPWIIIALLFTVILLQRECTPTPVSYTPPVYVYDTIYDTIIIRTKAYVPKLIYRDTGTTQWRWYKIDTAKILRSYFARQLYQDTIINDSNALIIMRDTISQNQIIYRQPLVTLFPQITYRTQTVEVLRPQKAALYLGFAIGRNPSQFSLSPTAMLQSKKGSIYSFSYDLISHDMQVGMSWKISFKKKSTH